MERNHPMTLLSVTGVAVCKIECFRETRFAPILPGRRSGCNQGWWRERASSASGISAGFQSRLTNTITKLQVFLEWRPNIPIFGKEGRHLCQTRPHRHKSVAIVLWWIFEALTYRKNKNPFQRDRWATSALGAVSLTVGMAVRPTDGELRVFEEH